MLELRYSRSNGQIDKLSQQKEFWLRHGYKVNRVSQCDPKGMGKANLFYENECQSWRGGNLDRRTLRIELHEETLEL